MKAKYGWRPRTPSRLHHHPAEATSIGIGTLPTTVNGCLS
jgi:hypothetical protein